MPFKGVFEDNGKIVSYLDELRYYVMSKPKPLKEKPAELSPIQVDKQKLIRRLKGDKK